MVNKKRYIVLYILSFISFILVIVLRFNKLPPYVPLFFSKIDDNQLVDIKGLSILPLSSILLLFITNYFKNKYIDEDFIKKIFIYVGLSSSIALIWITVYIIFLVT